MRCNKCGATDEQDSCVKLTEAGWTVLGWERGAVVGVCKKCRETHKKGPTLNANGETGNQ